MKQSRHLARRRVEAELIGRVYREMSDLVGADRALEALTRAVEGAAFEEGRAMRAEAGAGPSLGHFKSILDEWDDAMEIEGVEETGDTWRFKVVRCHYIEFYEGIGLPPELVRMLSCARDAPVAKGYSDRLEFAREQTLAGGADHCDFCYRWLTADG